MATQAGKPCFLFYSIIRHKMVLMSVTTETQEDHDDFVESVNDFREFVKYKKNIKLFTEIEAFENWQEEESWEK